jgi:hypothetical protein
MSSFCALVLKGCLLNRFGVGVLSLPGPEPELLSLMVDTKALGILVQASEGPALVIGLDAFHLNHLGPGEHIRKLYGASALLLVLDDLPNVFLN